MEKHKVDLSTTDNDSQLLLKLHEQFSENQNHHQGLFIKILIALFALFGAFGYVLINTQGVELLKESTESYPIITLVLVAILISGVLLFLNLFVLNNGYAYRRDQYINQKIRKEFLKEKYNKIFGKNYKADNKGLLNYLPNFYSLFFNLITICQILISIIILKYTENNPLPKNILALAPTCSTIFYFRIYAKYIKNIKSKDELSFYDDYLLIFNRYCLPVVGTAIILTTLLFFFLELGVEQQSWYQSIIIIIYIFIILSVLIFLVTLIIYKKSQKLFYFFFSVIVLSQILAIWCIVLKLLKL